MNFIKFFNIFLIFEAFCDTFPFNNSEISSISQAIHEVAEEFYKKNQIQFDILIIRDEFYDFSQLIYQLGVQSEAKNSHRLSSISNNFDLNFATDNSALILTVSCNDYKFINNNFEFCNEFTKKIKFVVYIHDCGLDFIKNNIIRLVAKHHITFKYGSIEEYQFLLINDQDILHLATIEWFTESACNQP